MGNGNFGVLIWGVDRLQITINRSDFWDRRHEQHLVAGMAYAAMRAAFSSGGMGNLEAAAGQGMTCWPVGDKCPSAADFMPRGLRPLKGQGDYQPSRLPMGRFELGLPPGHYPWRGILYPASGCLVIEIRGRAQDAAGAIEFVLDPFHPLLLARDPQGLVRSVIGHSAWEWMSVWFRARRFPRPCLFREPNASGWVQECPADPAMAALCWQDSGDCWITMESGATGAAAVAAAYAGIDSGRQAGAPAIMAASRRWWRAYWRRSPRLHLPDHFFHKYFVYALYKFGCATSPQGGVPASLQGPWVEEYQPPPWCGDYHFNVNIQQIYTLAFGAGQYPHLLPLFDMLDTWRTVMQHNAKVMFGIDDGLVMGMLTTDRGHLIYYAPGCVLDPMVSGWTAHLYWMYYRYTGDRAFLKERAYPFMAGVMRAMEAMLERKNGRLSLPLAISAEFANERGLRVGRDPSAQLACFHMLADALLDASKVLGIPPRPSWRTIKNKLPRYTLFGKKGEERIAVWEGQDLSLCHRHHSHLAGIYPFDSLGQWTPRTRRILDNSIDHWIRQGMGQWSEWCLPWAAILQARMGFTESPMVLMNLWREVFVNEGLASVYLPRFPGIIDRRRANQRVPLGKREVMQLDGTMGAATALLELLVHQRQGLTYIFPAIPKAWRNVAFLNIRIPGAFIVSAEKKNGIITRVEIQSLVGGSIILMVPGTDRLVLTSQPLRHVSFPLRLNLSPGERIVLTAQADGDNALAAAATLPRICASGIGRNKSM